MIRPDDRVLVALSGGKDSLTLLHALRHLQRRAPLRFEIGAATVDPGIEGFDPSYLRTYVPALEIPLFLPHREDRRARTHDHAWRLILFLLCAHAPRHPL